MNGPEWSDIEGLANSTKEKGEPQMGDTYPDYTILLFEEQNLRLDTQDGVCGKIRGTRQNALLVALYQRLSDEEKERIHNMMKDNLEGVIEKEFTKAMRCMVEELVTFREGPRAARRR